MVNTNLKFYSHDRKFSEWLDDNQRTVRANINGLIVIVDLASEEANAYDPTECNATYIGCGTYYTIRGAKQNDNKPTHFWKRLSVIDNAKELGIKELGLNKYYTKVYDRGTDVDN